VPAAFALALLLTAPANPAGPAGSAPKPPASAAPERGAGAYAVAAGTTAAGGGVGTLLAIAAGLPLVYAAQAGAGDGGAAGAGLLLLLAIPVGAGLGAGGMCAFFADGPGPWLTGVTVGVTTLLAFTIATGAIAGQVPSTAEQQLQVAMVYTAPVLTAAVVGALVGMLALPRPKPEEPLE
jgi:hypothetical protein